MADCQITCINLSSGGSGHQHITHVGNGSNWRWTVAEVVVSIKTGTNTFYVLGPNGKRADVGVVDGSPPYLRTYADKYYNDNLLSLTICPR